MLPDDELNAWGWRVPFLLGFLMIGVALWVRLRVEESPVFQEVQRSQKVVKLPVVEALKRYPRSVLGRHRRARLRHGGGLHVRDVHRRVRDRSARLSRASVLGAVVTYGLLVIALQPVFGALSDRIGRRPLNLFGVDLHRPVGVPVLRAGADR